MLDKTFSVLYDTGMDLNESTGAFANRVQEARLRKGWTMSQLAARAGITRQNVSLIERQRGQRPKDRTMDALAKALEVDRSWLFFIVPSEAA